MAEEVTTITPSCMCKSSTYTINLLSSSLPIPTYLCHCDTSRRISGALFTAYAVLPLAPSSPAPDLSRLTAYESSKSMTRYFCPTCGTHMFLRYTSNGRIGLAVGTLENPTEIAEIKGHIWISDTLDGGASEFLTHINGRELERWSHAAGTSSQLPLGWIQPPQPAPPSSTPHPNAADEANSADDTIPARCHCTTITFRITRPNASSLTATSPYPDLLVPYYSGRSAANPANEPWWLRPAAPPYTKYLAGTCACPSCRHSSGHPLTFWSFIPRSNLLLPASSRSSLRTYASSEGVTRSFCPKCGASVFWDGNWRETLADVAVGLLEAEEGARAQEWLGWVERVSFEEMGADGGLVGGLEEGLKRFLGRGSG